MPRFSPEEIREQLQPGDTVDWCGQPCKVVSIDLGKAQPLRLEFALSPGRFQEAAFEDINDILGKSLRGRAVDLFRGLRAQVKQAVSNLL